LINPTSVAEQVSETRRKKKLSRNLGVVLKGGAESFHEYLIPSSFTVTDSTMLMYDPSKLDNPDLKASVKSKKVIALPSYCYTVFQYTRPQDLKQEINDYFRSTHPHVDPGLLLLN
jgi:hypothetical protein